MPLTALKTGHFSHFDVFKTSAVNGYYEASCYFLLRVNFVAFSFTHIHEAARQPVLLIIEQEADCFYKSPCKFSVCVYPVNREGLTARKALLSKHVVALRILEPATKTLLVSGQSSYVTFVIYVNV